MDQFWTTMEEDYLVYLGSHPKGQPNALPIKNSADSLPTSFSFTSKNKSMSDDPWRALAGFSRKVKTAPSPAPECSKDDDKYCERCMFRGCVDGSQSAGPGVYFFEFRWAYFMNDATMTPANWWPSDESWAEMRKAYDRLKPNIPLEDIDVKDWESTAALVTPLCRAPSSAAYLLPSDLFPEFGSLLPGVVSGWEKLLSDPICSAPSSSSCNAMSYAFKWFPEK